MSMQSGSIDADGLARTSDGKLYVTLGSGTVLDPSAVVFGAEDTITAFATGGQTSATALSATKTFHRVSVCATAADSVKLPAATVGQAHYLRNDGAAAMQVFGQATETINGVASATGISHGIGMGVWYVCTTAGAWTTGPVTTFTATSDFRGGAAFSPVMDMGVASAGLVTFKRTDALNNYIGIGYDGTNACMSMASIGKLAWSSNSGSFLTGGVDASILRAAANSLQFGGTATAAAAATARTELNKAVTTIADAVATAVLTVTIPNAAHSASLRVRVTGSLGAGGAIGANEATANNEYIITFTRTAGVAAVAAISAAYGAAAAAVAGAATVTCTAAMSAVSGAVGATNTFTVNVTITRSGGSSTNHTCLVYAQLMNANATGVTIA